MVLDPQLAQHIAHFGIDIMNMTKVSLDYVCSSVKMMFLHYCNESVVVCHKTCFAVSESFADVHKSSFVLF